MLVELSLVSRDHGGSQEEWHQPETPSQAAGPGGEPASSGLCSGREATLLSHQAPACILALSLDGACLAALCGHCLCGALEVLLVPLGLESGTREQRRPHGLFHAWGLRSGEPSRVRIGLLLE